MADAMSAARTHVGLSPVPTVVWIVLGIGAVGYVLVSRLRGEALRTRRLLVLPAVFTGLGLVEISDLIPTHRDTADLVLLAVGAVLSLGLGAARGATVVLYRRGGFLWQRYRLATVMWWLVLIAVRVGLAVIGQMTHAPLATSSQAIMLLLGLTFLAESAAVAPRAMASGVPFIPDPRGDRRGRTRAGLDRYGDGRIDPHPIQPPGAYDSETDADGRWQAPSWRHSVSVLAERFTDSLS